MYLTTVALHLIYSVEERQKVKLYTQDKRNIYVANESFRFWKIKIKFNFPMECVTKNNSQSSLASMDSKWTTRILISKKYSYILFTAWFIGFISSKSPEIK